MPVRATISNSTLNRIKHIIMPIRCNEMKSLSEIKETIRKYKPTLRSRFKVKRIGIFGSFVRGEQKRTSDIDILVELSAPIGWEFVDLKEYLESRLKMNVDVVTMNALRPELKKIILKEVVYT
jgi:uncharacterized protein